MNISQIETMTRTETQVRTKTKISKGEVGEENEEKDGIGSVPSSHKDHMEWLYR